MRTGKQHNTVSIIILMAKTDQSQMILENTGEYAQGPYIIFTTCLCFRVPRGMKPWAGSGNSKNTSQSVNGKIMPMKKRTCGQYKFT